MTETRSCKLFGGSFKPYLIYKIKRQKNMLILSAIFNALSLPVLSTLCIFSGRPENLDDFAFIFAVICGAALLICSAAGPLFAFGHYIRKEQTDTVYSLPLSYNQRFWGDFLSGYITSTSTFIPAGLISFIMLIITDVKYEKYGISLDMGIPAAFGIVLTLFFVFTFAYLISAVVVSCCGKTVTAIVFTAAAYVAEWFLFAGLGVSFLSGILVMSLDASMNIITSLAQPFGYVLLTIASFMDGSPLSDFYNAVRGYKEEGFAVLEPAVIVVYIFMAAGFIFLAYRIGKKRSAEKTGNRVVSGIFLKCVEAAFAAGTFLFLISMIDQVTEGVSGVTAMAVVPFICSAAVFTVCEVLRFPKIREIPKSFLRYGIAFAGSIGLFFLFRQTGSFGMRYYTPNLENIHSMTIYPDPNDYTWSELKHNGLTFTEKEDIKRFQELNHEFVKDYCQYFYIPYDLWGSYTNGYRISYRLENGKELRYLYYIRSPYLHEDKVSEIHERFRDDIQSLPSYMKAMTNTLWQYTVKGCSADLNGSEKILNVSADKTEEFVKIFREDIEENHFTDTGIGTVTFYFEYYKKIRQVSFSIPESFNKTKAFLSDTENLSEQNSANPVMYEILLSFPYGNGAYGEMEFNMYLSDQDMDIDRFTELLEPENDIVSADTQDVKIEAYSVTEDKMYYIPKDKILEAARYIFRGYKSIIRQNQ